MVAVSLQICVDMLMFSFKRCLNDAVMSLKHHRLQNTYRFFLLLSCMLRFRYLSYEDKKNTQDRSEKTKAVNVLFNFFIYSNSYFKILLLRDSSWPSCRIKAQKWIHTHNIIHILWLLGKNEENPKLLKQITTNMVLFLLCSPISLLEMSPWQQNNKH